ncbi:MAG TPA: hypothetical protein VE077_17035, partial [Candidatus Methylomirabilis sp.]|nr:hypothetical protein [Candidatus Methylomirabilis sp.]
MSAMNELPSVNADELPGRITELTLQLTPFDQRQYRKLFAANDATIRRVVAKLKPAFGLSSALDAACGVGSYSHTLEEYGFNV